MRDIDKESNNSIDLYKQVYVSVISWPILVFFEVACSLVVLHCTLRKIQPNIQGGGAYLQRTVPVYQCGYQIYCTATYSTVLSTSDICTNLL